MGHAGLLAILVFLTASLAVGQKSGKKNTPASDTTASKKDTASTGVPPTTKGEMSVGATAYSKPGTTASGDQTGPGVIAADPKVLPLGTKVKVTNAGKYSGHYTVKDTGRRIRGRKIDVFVPSHSAARKFGKKRVKVKVIKRAPPAAADIR